MDTEEREGERHPGPRSSNTLCENLLKDAGQHLHRVGLPCIGPVTRQISAWGAHTHL